MCMCTKYNFLQFSGFPPGFAIAGTSESPFPKITTEWQPEDKKSEGIVWGVPKRRRSVEKRLTRRFGLKEWTWKMLIPKYNLLICDNCGHHYEAKHMCSKYSKAYFEF